MSGSQHTGPISATIPVNATVQVFDVTKPAGHRLSAEQPTPSPFSPHFPAGHQDIDLYPWCFVLPDGRLLVPCRDSTQFWHPGTPGRWDPTILEAQRKQWRTYPGQVTLRDLPLRPEDGHPVRLMTISGGALIERSSTGEAATTTPRLTGRAPRPWRRDPGWRRRSDASPACCWRRRAAPTWTCPSFSSQLRRETRSGVDPLLTTSSTARPPTPGRSSRRSTARTCTTRPRSSYRTAASCVGGKDGQFQRDPYKYFEHRLELFSPPTSSPVLVHVPLSAGARTPTAHIAVGCPTRGSITGSRSSGPAPSPQLHMDQLHQTSSPPHDVERSSREASPEQQHRPATPTCCSS